MKKSEKQGTGAVLKFSEHKRKRVDEFEADVDALFRLPLSDFTGARNELAARLKKSGQGDEAVRVKTLGKPSISAWAVNQLHWNYREDFDGLMASAERFHKAQKSGKAADMRAALEARRDALTQLSDLADSVLREAGHNSSRDTIHRVTTTLEGISAYASRSDTQPLGRLSEDVDPPGFESFGSFIPGPTKHEAGGRRQTAEDRKPKPGSGKQVPSPEEMRKAKRAAAKVSLQEAKKALTEARSKAGSLEGAQKRADAEAKKAEKLRREAETTWEKAKAAAVEATRRARNVAAEAEKAASAVDDAEREVETASNEFESSLRKS